jgi:hypothetical protein
MTIIRFFLIMFGCCGFLNAQTTEEKFATTDDGQRVIISSDGTWKFFVSNLKESQIVGTYKQVEGTVVGDIGDVKYVIIEKSKFPQTYGIKLLKIDKSMFLKGNLNNKSIPGTFQDGKIHFSSESADGGDKNLPFTIKFEGLKMILNCNWMFGTHVAHFEKI